MKKILIVNVNWLGDVLFSTPIFKALKKKYPDSFVACMVPGRCVDILKGNPHLDEIIVFDERSEHRGILAKIKFISSLRKKKFDTAFLLHRSFTRTLIVYLAGVKERIGYFTKKRGFLLTQRIDSSGKDNVHRLDYYANLFESQGIKVEDKSYEIFVSEDDNRFIERLLLDYRITKDDFVVVINPGGNWDLKRWPKESFAKLADILADEFNVKIIITGDKQDVSLAENIRSIMKAKPVILAGKTTLKQLAGLLKRVNLVITADSGPMHIASAVGAKLVALFGPTSSRITGPYNIKNSLVIQSDVDCQIPCYHLDCKDNFCMKKILPEEVAAKIKQHFFGK